MTHYSLLSTALCAVLMSFIHSGLTQDSPRSTLTVTPDTVFTGERVRLKCVIESDQSDWRYVWWRGDTYYTSDSQLPERYSVKENTLTIEGSESSDAGQYTCGGRIEGYLSSESSSAVSLSVKDLPKPQLTVDPESRVFTGEKVILTCEIESDHRDWRYEWNKDSVKLQSSQRYTLQGNTLTIKQFGSSDAGQYTCRGHITGGSVSTQSSSVSLSVKDLPKPQLTVDPDRPVFTGERVILMCEIESDHRDWRYEWNKDSVNLQSSQRYTLQGNTLTIKQFGSSDAGQYTCRGRIDGGYLSSESNPVSLSVKVSDPGAGPSSWPGESSDSEVDVTVRKDLPKPQLTVDPDRPVFTGERVRLKCEIESYSVWRYEWNKDSVKLKSSQRYTLQGNTLTIKQFGSSDAGQYTCRGNIDGGYLSSESNPVSLSVKDLPKPELSVTPDRSVFTGETVNLKCVIESYRGWRYEWNKDSVKLQSSERYTVNTDTLTIRAVTTSDEGQYTCRGQRDKRPNSSQESEPINLSVNDLPRSTLTVTPDNTVFTGERVSLTCEIESDHRDWRYEWWKDSVKLQSSQRHTVDRNTLTIEGSESSDEGWYTCRGKRDERPNSSQFSYVSLSVKDLPRSTLTVTPDNTVFTGERVRLTCEIESDRDWRWRNGLTHDQRYDQTPDWRYEWNKDSVKLQSSDRYTVNTDTLTIRAVTTSDEGQYMCRGQRDKRPNSSQSSSVSLSVTDLPKTNLTVDPDSPVFTGETVNLKCVIESNHTDWRYEWYKGRNNSVKLQSSERYTVNTDTLTIRGATESDRGQFWCRGHIEGRSVSSQESEPINLSVNASSSRLVTGVVVGSSVCLLFFLSLLLMWRYKKNKDQQRNINQTSVPNQSAQSQLENFPLQSDSDHIYNNETEVNKRDKDDSDPLTDVTYSEVTVTKKMDKAKAESNNVTYSEVGKRGKKCESKDINPAGPSDLTYAQINIQDKKKTKGKGKSSESGDTLYSELKQNTDRDADAGVGDTTSALAFWKKGQKKINKTCP